ncbi:aldehyde dehydrogenase family protein [Psychrobacillus sp. Sa2BUA9]|uniref:Aldehyde dehydrogenase family protein n=1 Tax=Psychrobacillus faecigallinarum TaxID=2762235 RepID=A0ABR8R5W2_9BACI|nr:aldehyde dehydrogenase family protein [Psychrobacillus faecigallinarum]
MYYNQSLVYDNPFQLGQIRGIYENHSLVYGGKAIQVNDYENSFYISPTIIVMIIITYRKKSVLSVVRFHSIEEAIGLANDTEYGLVAGVWSKDIDVAHYVAARVEAGQVFVNTYGAAGGVQMPFGGYKKSGIGREKSHLAVQNYVQIKNLAIHIKL